MTYEKFNEEVNKGVEEALGGDVKEIAKTKSQPWYQSDIDDEFRLATELQAERGANMTDEAYWNAKITTVVYNLIF